MVRSAFPSDSWTSCLNYDDVRDVIAYRPSLDTRRFKRKKTGREPSIDLRSASWQIFGEDY